MWPFKKKPKLEDQLAKILMKENQLQNEGWKVWMYQPPFGYEQVYARRRDSECVDIIKPSELHPYFNVADLWWMPHYGENQLN